MGEKESERERGESEGETGRERKWEREEESERKRKKSEGNVKSRFNNGATACANGKLGWDASWRIRKEIKHNDDKNRGKWERKRAFEREEEREKT